MFDKTLGKLSGLGVTVLGKKRAKVHLLHVGKTGGTAVKHAFKSSGSKANRLIVLHPHSTTLRNIPEGEGVIFFLRDPLSRFESGFLSRQRQGRPRYFSPWNPGEEAAFTRFETPNGLALAIDSSNEVLRGEAIKAMRSIQHVRSHYRDWFESQAYVLERANDIFFVGFQESLVGDFERLKAELGLPMEASLPEDNVIAHKRPTSVAEPLEAHARQNLMRWYADDLKFLDFCKARFGRRDEGLEKP